MLRHFVGGNSFSVWCQSLSFSKVFLEGIIYPSGKVGVVLFFLISAWFLCEGSNDMKQSFYRVWVLERELLFYGVIIVVYLALFHRESLTAKGLIGALFPLSTELWWYPTSYALFLMFLPFLTAGLHSLGRTMHRNLCILCFVLWSVCGGLVSFISFDMVEQNVIIFLYLYILVSYWRWYGIAGEHRRDIALFAIGGGYFISVCSVIFLTLITVMTGRNPQLQTMTGQNEWMLPVMLIGFGMFALFKDWNFHSRVVNSLAKSTFAVYLISAHPGMPSILWGEWFNMTDVYGTLWLIPYMLIAGLAVYAGCTLIDYIRRGLFTITVDRHPGRWFNAVLAKIVGLRVFDRICDDQ